MPITDKIVMIVEDHAFQRHTVARMLKSLDAAAIVEAANGKEALALLSDPATPQPDIAVCDLDMPEMDGMEFIRHLSKVRPGISVLITSALDRELLGAVENMSRAYGIRMLGVIKKPVSLQGLREMLNRSAQSPARHTGTAAAVLQFDCDAILAGIRNREFEAYFQPKVDFHTGQVVGAEALARWRHPQHGIVGPNVFIPPLEKNGRIDELTFLMIEQAASACQHWIELGLNLNVSVNLSTVSLADTSLAEQILHTVRATGLDPRYMILEITESAAMTDIAPMLENLTRLRMRGFGLSIDDYGTGFSSMQQLARLPFTELKIDRGFVSEFVTNPAARKIVQSSVNLAHELAIKSVAEGVETQGDWDALQALGCDIAQGFFIARPMEQAAFMDFSRSRQRALSSVSSP